MLKLVGYSQRKRYEERKSNFQKPRRATFSHELRSSAKFLIQQDHVVTIKFLLRSEGHVPEAEFLEAGNYRLPSHHEAEDEADKEYQMLVLSI